MNAETGGGLTAEGALEHITIPLRSGDLELAADGADIDGRLLLVDRKHGIDLALPWELFAQLAEIHDVVMLVNEATT